LLATTATDRAIEAAAAAAHEAEIAQMTATVQRLHDQAERMRVFIAENAEKFGIEIPADMMMNRERGESVAYDRKPEATAAAPAPAAIAEVPTKAP
jgi:hypothetical protein